MDHIEFLNKEFYVLARLTEKLSDLERRRTVAIQEIDAMYGPEIQVLRPSLDITEANIRSYLRKHQAAIFGDGDRIETTMGSAIRAVITRVRKARGVLEKLKTLGLGAVKIAESVDWDELEKWPDEQLGAVGTNRVTKVEFNYELKGSHTEAQGAQR